MNFKLIPSLLICCLIIFFTSCSSDPISDPLSGSSSSLDCEDTNCEDYSSRYEAQLDYDWNPDCRNDLDADNDGLACEENNWTEYYSSLNSSGDSPSSSGGGSSNSGCPTTSNCGCSGLNKSPCESNSCCKWVVGDGCECR